MGRTWQQGMSNMPNAGHVPRGRVQESQSVEGSPEREWRVPGGEWGGQFFGRGIR